MMRQATSLWGRRCGRTALLAPRACSNGSVGQARLVASAKGKGGTNDDNAKTSTCPIAGLKAWIKSYHIKHHICPW